MSDREEEREGETHGGEGDSADVDDPFASHATAVDLGSLEDHAAPTAAGSVPDAHIHSLDPLGSDEVGPDDSGSDDGGGPAGEDPRAAAPAAGRAPVAPDEAGPLARGLSARSGDRTGLLRLPWGDDDDAPRPALDADPFDEPTRSDGGAGPPSPPTASPARPLSAELEAFGAVDLDDDLEHASETEILAAPALLHAVPPLADPSEPSEPSLGPAPGDALAPDEAPAPPTEGRSGRASLLPTPAAAGAPTARHHALYDDSEEDSGDGDEAGPTALAEGPAAGPPVRDDPTDPSLALDEAPDSDASDEDDDDDEPVRLLRWTRQPTDWRTGPLPEFDPKPSGAQQGDDDPITAPLRLPKGGLQAALDEEARTRADATGGQKRLQSLMAKDPPSGPMPRAPARDAFPRAVQTLDGGPAADVAIGYIEGALGMLDELDELVDEVEPELRRRLRGQIVGCAQRLKRAAGMLSPDEG